MELELPGGILLCMELVVFNGEERNSVSVLAAKGQASARKLDSRARRNCSVSRAS
jgi:hypothetical protein